MKKLGYAITAFGLVWILISVMSDYIGLGKDVGVGLAQMLGIELGVVSLLLGVGILNTKLDRVFLSWERDRKLLDAIRNLSPLVWIYFAFFITYLLFFLFPVFLNSKLEIQYVQKYISDAGKIGFDIRATVHRIEDWFLLERSPYADGFIAYPPLTIVLFSPFVLVGYPAYFIIMTIITIFCYVSVTLITPLMINKGEKRNLLLFLFSTGLFSYGLQFELERGQFNVISFALCLFAIYLYHERSELRYWSYLLFSVAVQLKVYPVFFIVMFIQDWRDWGGNARRILGLGVFNFSLLFILGYQMFLDFIHRITAFQGDYQSNRYENLSIKGFVHSLASGEIVMFPGNIAGLLQQHASILEMLFFALWGLCLLSVLVHAHVHKLSGFNPFLLLICVIGTLIIPSVSNDYKLSILTAPLAMVLCSLPAMNDPRRRVSLILLVFIASLAYWSTLYPFSAKPDIFARNFPALLIILISITLLNFLAFAEKSTTTASTNNERVI